MKFESLISSETIQTYHETEFRVFAKDIVVLKISEKSQELLDLFWAHRSDACAFVTAFKPLGELLSYELNAAVQKQLEEEIQFKGLTHIAGEGKHPTGGWLGEPSFLVFGLSLEAAKTLGRRFHQNAVVWCGSDAVPNLLLLR